MVAQPEPATWWVPHPGQIGEGKRTNKEQEIRRTLEASRLYAKACDAGERESCTRLEERKREEKPSGHNGTQAAGFLRVPHDVPVKF